MQKWLNTRYLWGPLLYALTACSVPTTPAEAPQPSASPTAATTLADLTLPETQASPQAPPQASPRASAAPAAAAAYRLRNIVYWRVQAPDPAVAPSYMVGTVHLNLAADYTWPAAFTTALSQSKSLYLEADTRTLENNPQAVLEKTIDTEQALANALDDATLTTLIERLAPLGLPPVIIPSLQAWYINILLSTPPAEAIGDPQTIMDNRLRGVAENEKVPVNYLEGAIEQLDMMAAIPFAEHVRLIQETLRKPADSPAQETQETVRQYNQGELETLAQEIERLKTESPPFYDHSIVQRNQKWLATLQPVLAAEPVVVGVGLLHLLGPEGLLAQLEAAGFTVTRVGVM